MAPYWILFGVFLVGAVQFSSAQAFYRYRYVYYAANVGVWLMIGLRYKVGADWPNYQDIYNSIYFASFGDAMRLTDPGYALFNIVAIYFGFDIWFVNLLCAALVVFGVARFAQRQPNPWLAMLVAIPYLIIVVAMGYTRQAAAIGIICLGISDPKRDSLPRITAYILVAALMHKTAVLILPIVLVPFFRRNLLTGVLGIVAFALAYVLFVRSSADAFVNQYVQSNYDSQGAAVRVAMNVLAAALILTLGKKMNFDAFDRNYWRTNAFIALLCVPALFLASAPSGIDRIALFLIPMQIVALGRLPYLARGRANLAIMSAVAAYLLVAQLAWLMYAANAQFWLPYRMVLGA